ncbi:acetylornithine transaminase [Eupransor demetentiae]|uniref:Acetylornithine/succinyldiaminopimelate/putrescin e aminotransferase (ArgD) n=1 Tax=Eupransor demetentiae TaxID=3109584 RepID=A0ABM9N683_9LACO|nr:Acetylornithine/succinyldiaminopimelate/putrescine aminotransferase (ArgD) [Lactobacillaceae bacterium LMG 33000]
MNPIMNTYQPFPIELVDGHDFHLVDKAGKTYLDLTSGIGVCNLGYSNKPIYEAVSAQLKKVWHLSNLYPNAMATAVAEKLNPAGYQSFFCNSGTEANEAALKLAHKATGKSKVIAFQEGFHGRTIGSLSVTGYPHIQEGFGPLIADVQLLDYNDQAALKAIDAETAAVILEVVQGEGGVNTGKKDWLQAIQKQCQAAGALLIIDEVQSGMGRTGYKFAHEAFDLQPDIITVAKGLGNGLPVGAMLAKAEVAAHFKPGDHGNTFGGNPVVMAAANQVLAQLTPIFLATVQEKGEKLFAELDAKIKPLPAVLSISGLGLMVGIHLDAALPVKDVISKLQEKGILTLSARGNTLRLLPPLIIDETALKTAVESIAIAIQELSPA